MKPLIAHSDLTGRWYVVTRYKVEEPGQIIASQKYDVTEQIKAILSKANLPAIPLFDDEEKADALQSVEKISVEREERSSRGRRNMSNYFCSCATCACQTLVVVEFTICEDCKHENHKFRRKERAYD